MDKQCSACEAVKPIGEFYKNILSKDGHQAKCSVCARVKARARRVDSETRNRDRLMAARRYYAMSAEQRKELRQKAYDSGKNAIWCKRYRENNKEKVARMAKQNMRKRRKNNPQFRLSDSMSSLMRNALRYNNLSKNNTTWKKLAGYTEIELQEHLELQFVDGMTWDNYGEWHVDHIIPISFFQYKSPNDVEFKICWRLENLQPMLAMDNKMKSNKIMKVA